MSQQQPRSIVVLAAGEGKRMRSALPKVLHPLLGRTLLGHVLAAADGLAADHTYVVVGTGAEQVAAHLAEIAPKAIPVHQTRQGGTGHAVRVALAAGAGSDRAGDGVGPAAGTVVVLNGDAPLLRAGTLRWFVDSHEAAGVAATVLSAELPDPTGLGRIVRDARGAFARIAEERDATAGQRAVREVNAGVYAFDAALLRDALAGLDTDNDQGEEYLTDVPGRLVASGHRVAVLAAPDPLETLGCNDRAELAAVRARLRDRVNLGWMRAGVTILDPATTWIDVTASVGPDSVLDQNTQLRGHTVLGAGAAVGPDVSLIDTMVGEGASVVRAHAVQAQVGPAAQVGPYAYLRPGARLARGAKVGTYVEVKNAEIGEGAKVPHLSYVGDATIGEHTNIGAATVFVNYDGIAKHHTTIGRHARTGADNMFVAPVEVGDGAYTAAGSVINKDVPPGALGVARGQQRNIDGWVRRRRPGTAAAEAAGAAETAGAGGAAEAAAGPDPAPEAGG